MSDLLALIDRLQAPGACWTITDDVEIGELVGAEQQRPVVVTDLVTGEPALMPLPYGSSIDAAATLVPDEFKASWRAGFMAGQAFAEIGHYTYFGVSPAAALCLGALKLRVPFAGAAR